MLGLRCHALLSPHVLSVLCHAPRPLRAGRSRPDAREGRSCTEQGAQYITELSRRLELVTTNLSQLPSKDFRLRI